MLFLFNLFKPSTWLSGALPGVMGALLGAVRTFFFWLVTIIYELLINVYNLFERLCNARLLDNSILEALSKRVGIILGIIMFFYIIFSLIQMVIDPDKITNKDSGAATIVKKTIIVIVMLGVSGATFELLFNVQKKIIEENIISRVILPFSVDKESEDKFGNLLSASLLKVFYYTENEEQIENLDPNKKVENYEAIKACGTIVNSFYAQVYNSNKYSLGYMCLNESVKVISNDENSSTSYEDETYIVSFNGILAVLVGAYMVYILVIYCFKVGVRMIQLTFLEIISPMPIIAYMSPKKDNMFKKWYSLYFSTYIDVFIRIAIIDFAVFLICIVFSQEGEGLKFWETVGETTPVEKGFFLVVIVLALLTFAKKAPDLIKQLLPEGAAKLGFGASMKDIFGLKGGIGMVAGAGTSAAVGLIGGIAGGKGFSRFTGAIGGVLGGAFRGGKAGLGAKGLGKAISSASSNQAKVNIARAQRITSGATLSERAGDKLRGVFGIQSGYEGLNQELSMSTDIKDTLGKEDIIKHIREVRQSYIQSCAATGTTADVNKLAAYDTAEKDALRQMYAFSHNEDTGSIWVKVDDEEIGLHLFEEYKTNRGIHNKIANNEKRAGATFATYDDKNVELYNKNKSVKEIVEADRDKNWKADNNELKNRIADKTKSK